MVCVGVANIELLGVTAGTRPEEADSEGLAAVDFDSRLLELSPDLWPPIESFLRVEEDESEDRCRREGGLGAFLAFAVCSSSGDFSTSAVLVEGDLALYPREEPSLRSLADLVDVERLSPGGPSVGAKGSRAHPVSFR